MQRIHDKTTLVYRMGKVKGTQHPFIPLDDRQQYFNKV